MLEWAEAFGAREAARVVAAAASVAEAQRRARVCARIRERVERFGLPAAEDGPFRAAQFAPFDALEGFREPVGAEGAADAPSYGA
ncbi:hypothetical protein [Granulimonas faecalis]|uniref:hypothetical protein n=1 Tax=Granulimonas faecalis TaxID=2894155 RepID=UPI00351410B3